MSNNSNTDQKNTNDEIDLGQLFNAIGNLINRLFGLIGSILRSVFSYLIFILKDVIVNFKLLIGMLAGAILLGYAADYFKEPKYNSEMIVETYFDSKYQLVANINYYNNLLEDQDYALLSNIFKIEESAAQKIKSFEIEPGPETENDRILEYDNFLKSIDSTRALEVSYDDFIENRDIHTGNLFIIRIESTQKDIFKSLESGLNTSFDNGYSSKKMEERDSLIEIQKGNLLASINEVKQLQRIYIEVLEEEAQSTKASINLGEGFPLQQEKSETKEYQLLNQEIKLRDELRRLEELKVKEDVFFDIISGFQRIGNKSDGISSRFIFVLPSLVLILIVLVYFAKRTIKFVMNYE